MRPGNWYRGSYELIMFMTAGKARRQFGGGERDVWRIKNSAAASIVNCVHPSQKPIELMERMILNSTAAGEVFMDSFMGSGTTGVAAVNTGRKFIGFELDEKFFGIAEKRIAEAQARKAQELF